MAKGLQHTLSKKQADVESQNSPLCPFKKRGGRAFLLESLLGLEEPILLNISK